ncbi:MAG TPA: acetoacetate--CoA ligase [Ktedonobacteraceae bacterium]|nr:acetoacetate--CoA ligase [Ktedonobacteraceae bacterium]
MATPVSEGMLLWEPAEQVKEQANIRRYMQWLEREKGLHFTTPQGLWAWSVDKLEDFWASLWDYFHIKASKPYETVLVERKMPGAQWFSGAQLNYAEHVFRNATSSRPAALFKSEAQPLTEISWDELYGQVRNVAAALRDMGVRRGDRVVSYMPNIPQSLIAFLATASIGAIWSSCSPDFGTHSVIDRFQQIEPTVLFAVDGYQYAGKIIDRRAIISEIQEALPTLRKTVVVPYAFNKVDISRYRDAMSWRDIPESTAELVYEQVPFNHPLWVLYSSGTTGLPKAIVQGQGGILLEHMKSLHLDLDLKQDDRFFWFTTTGWMMWNLLLGGLLLGIPVLLYDGSPGYPDMNALWQFAEQSGMTFFGTSAGYILACMKAEITPGKSFNLGKLRALGSTGSPLPPEGFQWIYEQIKSDLWLASVSGGTDVCSAFLGGCVLLPVYAGELQARSLGAKVEAFDDNGHALTGEVGELVITEPMPSMPLFFWNDPQGNRYRESYFEMYPGIWRHGDWIKITPRGSAVIYGRSDSTINRKGIRMGSSEIYRVVDETPEVLDSLIIGIERPGGAYYMPLFVVLKPGVELDDALKTSIRASIRANLSPHHVPDEIIAISEVPRTLSGKKLEVPVKKLFMGVPLEKAISVGAMSNPQVMQYFVEFAKSLMNSNDQDR